MFVMIARMRLAVGVGGVGIASAVTDTALQYARDREQGRKNGRPSAIAEHVDVQRMLLEMVARTETLRALVMTVANQVDIAEYAIDPLHRVDAAALVEWLLPIVKTAGGDTAFEVDAGHPGAWRRWIYAGVANRAASARFPCLFHI